MYVYALGDPRTQEVRYVGIAKDVYLRYAAHLNHPHPNNIKNAWMDDIKSAGIVPTLTILESDVEADVIYAHEKHWIQYYQARGASLTNIMHGECTRNDNSFSTKQIAALLSLSERTVFRLIKAGKLRGFKAGREWRFEESDIEAFIQEQRQEAARNREKEQSAA